MRSWPTTAASAVAVLVLVVAAGVADASGDREEPVEGIGPGEALLIDASDYSAQYGVSVAAAAQRLRLQTILDETIERIHEASPDRFAGGWIEHEPDFRAVVSFTAATRVSRPSRH